jgi:hypothetical protein
MPFFWGRLIHNHFVPDIERKNEKMPEIQDLTVNPTTSDLKESLATLPEGIREECLMSNKN